MINRIITVSFTMFGIYICQLDRLAILEAKAAPLTQSSKFRSVHQSFANAKNPTELMNYLIEICRNSNESDISAIIEMFNDNSKLEMLIRGGKEEMYRRSAWRLHSVFNEFVVSHPEKAQKVLMDLGKGKKFMSDPNRNWALYMSFGYLKSPSSEVLQFIESLAIPGSTHSTDVNDVLTRIGTREAFDILERRFFLSGGSREAGIFVYHLMPFRNTEGAVAFSHRVLLREIRIRT